MRHAQTARIAPSTPATPNWSARAGARRGGGSRHHAGEQSQALPARPRHPAQRRRGRGRRAGNLCPRVHASGKFPRRFQPLDLAVADRHERGAGPAAPPAARRRAGLAAAGRAGGRRSSSSPSPPSEDPEKSMAQREIQHVVEHAIDELPEAFRLVFITRVIEGMNVEETAEILGVKPETVKTPAAPRPQDAARHRREENRSRGDGSVSVRRQALRAADGCRAEAAGFRLIFREPLRAPAIQLLCNQQRAGGSRPAPQECQTCSFD